MAGQIDQHQGAIAKEVVRGREILEGSARISFNQFNIQTRAAELFLDEGIFK